MVKPTGGRVVKPTEGRSVKYGGTGGRVVKPGSTGGRVVKPGGQVIKSGSLDDLRVKLDFNRKSGGDPSDKYVLIQRPLITDGRNSCKWTYHCEGLSKSFIMIKISGQKF